MSQSDGIKQVDDLIIHFLFVVVLIYAMASLHFPHSSIVYAICSYVGIFVITLAMLAVEGTTKVSLSCYFYQLLFKMIIFAILLYL